MSYILDLLYIHLFRELSWKSNISCLATCPIKKKGGLSAIITKVIGLTIQVGKDSERKCWIKGNLHGITVSITTVKVLTSLTKKVTNRWIR